VQVRQQAHHGFLAFLLSVLDVPQEDIDEARVDLVILHQPDELRVHVVDLSRREQRLQLLSRTLEAAAGPQLERLEQSGELGELGGSGGRGGFDAAGERRDEYVVEALKPRVERRLHAHLGSVSEDAIESPVKVGVHVGRRQRRRGRLVAQQRLRMTQQRQWHWPRSGR